MKNSQNIKKINFSDKNEKLLNNDDTLDIQKSFHDYGIIEFVNLPWHKNEIQNFTDYFTSKYSNDAARRKRKFDKTNINSVDSGHNMIPLHSEASFSYAYPEIIWFYCYENDSKGSPTTICDGEKLWEILDKETKKYFLKNPITFKLSIDIPYKNKNKDTEDLLIESLGVSNAKIDWKNGKMIFDHTKFVINVDKKSDKLWFANHLIVGSKKEDQIYDIYASDGKPIPLGILDEIKSKADDITIEYFWEKDCLLMLNNYRYMHGRKDFDPSSKREILNLQSLKINF